VAASRSAEALGPVLDPGPRRLYPHVTPTPALTPGDLAAARLPVWQVHTGVARARATHGAGQEHAAGPSGAAPNVIQAITENVCGRAWIYGTLML